MLLLSLAVLAFLVPFLCVVFLLAGASLFAASRFPGLTSVPYPFIPQVKRTAFVGIFLVLLMGTVMIVGPTFEYAWAGPERASTVKSYPHQPAAATTWRI
jgi:hypothetical protein